MTRTSTSKHTEDVLEAMRDRQALQAKCKHVFKAVPHGSGYMPYLQCPKCGKRESSDQ